MAGATLAVRVPIDVCNAVTPLLQSRYSQVRDDVLDAVMRRIDQIEDSDDVPILEPRPLPFEAAL